MVAASKQFVRLGLLEMQERDGSGTVTAENAWRPGAPGGIGGLLVRKSGEQKYTYMTNHLGHVHGVFDKTGNRVESHSYSAYGHASGDDFSLQPFGMSTKRSDFASGLVYFDYRFYVPHLGRWLNRDPLQDQGGINLYAYVQGDPLGYVDSDGRFAAVLIYAVPTVIAIAAFYDGLERCKALGRCDFSGLWHSNEAAESKGDSSDVPVNCPTDGSSPELVPRLSSVDDRLKYRGKPNSNIRGADVARKGGGKRAFITDENGKIVKEITPQRVKIRITNNLPDGTNRETFKKRPNGQAPTPEELDILDKL